MLRGRCHAPHPMMCAFTLHPLHAVCAAGHGRGGFHGALVQPRWKGRRALDGRRMPLACSSPVAARGVGLAHEKRRSLPWLEARNQHTGGLSRGRHGGRALATGGRYTSGRAMWGRPSMMRSNCQMPGPRPEPAEAGADIAQAVVNWGLSGGGSERSAVAAAWMPHEKPRKGAAGPTSNRQAPRDMLHACARQMRCDGGAAIAAAEAAGAPTRGPVEGAPTQGTVENEEEARPVRGGGGHRPKDRRGGGHRPEDRLDVDGSRRRFKLVQSELSAG